MKMFNIMHILYHLRHTVALCLFDMSAQFLELFLQFPTKVLYFISFVIRTFLGGELL